MSLIKPTLSISLSIYLMIGFALSSMATGEIAASPVVNNKTIAPSPIPSDSDNQSPDSDAKHDINKTLNMEKLRLHSAVHMYSFQPVRLEVQNDAPITLRRSA